MQKTIMIAAMAILIASTSAWAGGTHKSEVSQSSYKTSSDRLHPGHERKKMSDRMNDRERGPMLQSTSKKSSDRLQGKREKMTHKMDNKRHGAMTNTTPHEHGHRLEGSAGEATE